jgi:hypothetical protein
LLAAVPLRHFGLGRTWTAPAFCNGIETVAARSPRPFHEMPYRSMDTWIEECPSRVWMVLGCSPAAISQVAEVVYPAWLFDRGRHWLAPDSAEGPAAEEGPRSVVHKTPSISAELTVSRLRSDKRCVLRADMVAQQHRIETSVLSPKSRCGQSASACVEVSPKCVSDQLGVCPSLNVGSLA